MKNTSRELAIVASAGVATISTHSISKKPTRADQLFSPHVAGVSNNARPISIVWSFVDRRHPKS